MTSVGTIEGPMRFETHRREPLLPLVLGGLGAEVLTAVLGSDGRKRSVDHSRPRRRVRDDGEVRLGQLGLVVLVALLVRVAVPMRQLLLQPGRLGVQEGDRPDRHALAADVLDRAADALRVGKRDQLVHLVLERTHAEGDLGDDAGDAFGVRDVGKQLVATELTGLARGQDHARGHDVVLELTVLEAAEAGPALREPTSHARAGIRRRIQPKREPLLLDLAVDLVPDGRGMGGHEEVLGVDLQHAHHRAHVDHDRVLRRQHATVSGGRPRAGDDLQVLSAGELHELDDLLLGVRPNHGTRHARGHERLHELGHRPDVEGVHLALAPVGADSLAADDLGELPTVRSLTAISVRFLSVPRRPRGVHLALPTSGTLGGILALCIQDTLWGIRRQ